MRIMALMLVLTLAACGADGIPRHPDAPEGTPFPGVKSTAKPIVL